MAKEGVTVQSVKRAMMILECFTGPLKEMGITELANAMELSKSTLFGLVNTLLNEGYLEQNPENKKYRLGLKLFEMGSLVQRRMDIRQITRPYLEILSNRFCLTVHMAVYSSGEVVYIDKMDVPDAIIIYSQIGKRAPLHCTGIGKAILSYLPEAEIELLLQRKFLTKHTEHTIIEPEQLREELNRAHFSGFAVDNEEIEIGLRCVAAPIFDFQGRPIAALSISGAASQMTEEKILEISCDLKKVTVEISKKLGYNEIA